MRNNFEKLTIADVMLKERNDGSGEFPVAVIQGVSFNVSENGNQSFSKRKVHMPLNGLELSEAKALFPKGSAIEGFRIEQYTVDPYEFITEDGEVIVSDKRYRLKPLDESTEAQKAPATHSGQPTSTMEDAVFERKPRTNDLEPLEA